MWSIWENVTSTADVYLESLTAEQLSEYFLRDGQPLWEDIGKCLLRNIFHYWFHIGEAHSIRQMLGHENLPDFVGDLSAAIHSP